MKQVYIIRVSEIFLKGKNRPGFQRILLSNLKATLDMNEVSYELVNKNNRILLYSADDCSCIKDVFGLSNYSIASEVLPDIEEIREVAISLRSDGSFRVSAKRLDKKFPLTSPEINNEIGKSLDGEVNFKDPDQTIFVEVDTKQAFVFTEKIYCYGGLPLGSEGRVGVLVQENCLKAAWLLMRRGCDVTFFGDKIDVSPLEKFASGRPLIVQDDVPNVPAIVVSDTLGSLQDYDFRIPVLRPLVGFELSLTPL